MIEQKVVMYDSDDAAIYKTGLSGWVNNSGQYWGENEHMARWSGCTHMTCACGKQYEKGRVRCDSCQAAKDTEGYYAMPMVEWDEVTPVVVFNDDRYFFDLDSVLDFMVDMKEEAAKRGYDPEIQLVLCDPIHLHYIDADNWCDDLSEDGELPDAVQAKVDELNAAIKEAGPVSWQEGKTRINVDYLWEKLKKGEAKNAI